jgi:hypothetical protein
LVADCPNTYAGESDLFAGNNDDDDSDDAKATVDPAPGVPAVAVAGKDLMVSSIARSGKSDAALHVETRKA